MNNINGISKQAIIDLFVDCDMHVHVEQQRISYYKNNLWVGTYYLKPGEFYWSWSRISPFIDNETKGNYQLINELLRPILEEIVNRKVSTTYPGWHTVKRELEEVINRKVSPTK